MKARVAILCLLLWAAGAAAADDFVAGAVALADVIREESREAIARLKGMGIHCLMLTGDNRKVAAWVGEQKTRRP